MNEIHHNHYYLTSPHTRPAYVFSSFSLRLFVCTTHPLSHTSLFAVSRLMITPHVITRWLYMYVWIRPKSMIIER